MSFITLSIIVPVYNVEKYLERCVDSLVCQDIGMDDYEIILVNDGSTDGSGEICRKLQTKHRNINLIEQENKGLSAARNTGLRIAKGRYLLYVDSDDYISKNSIRQLIDLADKHELELCFVRTQGVMDDGKNWLTEEQPLEKYRVYSGNEALMGGMLISSVWQCLYSHSFLTRTKLLFHEGIVNEDIAYNMQLYPQVSRMMFTDIVFYHYNYSGISILRNKDPKKHQLALMSSVEIVNDIRSFMNHHKSLPREISIMYNQRCNSISFSSLISLFSDHEMYSKDFCHRYIDKCKAYSFYPIKGRTESWKSTLLLPLLNIEPLLRILLNLRHRKSR